MTSALTLPKHQDYGFRNRKYYCKHRGCRYDACQLFVYFYQLFVYFLNHRYAEGVFDKEVSIIAHVSMAHGTNRLSASTATASSSNSSNRHSNRE